MSGEFFFITGLPRTRSAWLANLLTTDDSFCFHDGLRGCGSMSDLRVKMDAVRESFPWIGNADSGVLLFWEDLLFKFPDARFVVIDRPVGDAARSFYNFFIRQPYPNVPVPNMMQTRRLFDWMQGYQTAFVNACPQDRLRRVPYAALNDEATVRGIFEFCLPGFCWSRPRFHLLHELRINVASDKVTAQPTPAQSLLTNLKL